MISAELVNRFRNIAGANSVKLEEPMSRHTTFRIGGAADVFITPADISCVPELIHICRENQIPYFILGNGSNLLVSDTGFHGVIIQIYHNLSKIEVSGNEIHAEAGALLVKLAAAARDAALTGLEFASGIPGTVGGAVTMNAGAYGGEIRQVLKQAVIIDENLQIREVSAAEMDLGYRHSRVQDCGWIVLSAVFALESGDMNEIAGRMEELKTQRVTKQPLEYPSAGSTFKRPEGYFAGKLIMDAGLRGYTVGGAQVSEKHCGFVINTGKASAADVQQLITDVKRTVFEKFRVELEPEVRFLGFGGEDVSEH